jgi:hypothetical protein
MGAQAVQDVKLHCLALPVKALQRVAPPAGAGRRRGAPWRPPGMAEGRGFEPPVRFYPYNRLAGGCLKPARPPLRKTVAAGLWARQTGDCSMFWRGCGGRFGGSSGIWRRCRDHVGPAAPGGASGPGGETPTPGRRGAHAAKKMAEGVGFEPTEPYGSTVFKTAPFNHSGSPPLRQHLTRFWETRGRVSVAEERRSRRPAR